MQIFEWKEEYQLGIDKLDNQHKRLVELLNDAHQQHNTEIPLSDRDLTLLELIDYAVFHLNYETKWRMRNNQEWETTDDPNGLRRKMLKIQNYYFRLTREHSQKVLSFMTRWVANHLTSPHA